jgi:hypothetical protein
MKNLAFGMVAGSSRRETPGGSQQSAGREEATEAARAVADYLDSGVMGVIAADLFAVPVGTERRRVHGADNDHPDHEWDRLPIVRV